ncbi:MAG: maleylacetoacetate isomerase [Acidovorax sp.]
MKLYSYFRSSASFRVRIALRLKGLPFDYLPVHLVRGDHRQAPYADAQGDALVPRLETDDGHLLSESLAIIEYLEETCPAVPRLLPADALGRAQVRALAQMVACEIHPLNNLRVLKYLVRELKVDEDAKNRWYRHWVRSGLEAFERQLALLAAERAQAGLPTSDYCWGDAPTLADCCLVPQIFNARRFDVGLDGLPRVQAAHAACMALPAFQQAQPSACPDAEA